MMSLGIYMIGIFFLASFCPSWGLTRGGGNWLVPNKDLMDEDIQKEVDQAIQLVNKATFQGWSLDQLKQVVPRLHIALIEMWLQFRKIPKEQTELLRKIRRSARRSAASVREVKAQVSQISNNVTARLDTIEKDVETILRRVEAMEDECRRECKGRMDLNQTKSQHKPADATEGHTRYRDHQAGSGGHKMAAQDLVKKVASLVELMNGHNGLLEELYQRVTALEGARTPTHNTTGRQEERQGDPSREIVSTPKTHKL